jgi:carbon-monoxide dehydrogenase medium subunit
MKAARFDYARPATLAEAIALIASVEEAKILAGGQTLGPLLNLRLAQPPLLVDITRIAELAQVAEESDAVLIGAIVTHAAIEDGRVSDPTGGFLAEVAAGIGYRAVRTRGTIGGSLAHADPAADWLTALTALGAELVLAGPDGRQRTPLDGFVRAAMATALGAEQLITGVSIPRFSRRARFGYAKICRKVGDFADAIAAVVHDPERQLRRVAVSTPTGAPMRIEADAWTLASPPAIAALEQHLIEAGFAGDAYERRLRAVVIERALRASVSA